MQRSLPVSVAILLAACGAATTTSNDAAESATQSSGKAKQQPRIGFENFDRGGMAGCFDPNLSGYARQQAERIGGQPCGLSASGAKGAEGQSDTDYAGHWSGQFDGGQGTVTIMRRSAGANDYEVNVTVAGNSGCSGEVSGSGRVSAGRLVLTEASEPDRICRVSFTRRGNSLAVSEDGCMAFHGMSCGFSGNARFVHGTDSLEPEGHAD